MLDFAKIGVIDIIDIAIVVLLVYQGYKFMKGTGAFSIFLGIILFYAVWIVSRALNMELLSAIMGQVMGVGVLALIVIFQQEIRHFFLRLGNKYMSSGRKSKIFKALFTAKNEGFTGGALNEITQACSRMSKSNTGALIVLKRNSSLELIIESGDKIDAIISRRLIENIFFKNAPMHDGAMVIGNNKIIAVRCTLPISESTKISARYGMRHRAAIGIREQSDAGVIVVSEETSAISFVQNGEIKSMNSLTELRIAIENAFK